MSADERRTEALAENSEVQRAMVILLHYQVDGRQFERLVELGHERWLEENGL